MAEMLADVEAPPVEAPVPSNQPSSTPATGTEEEDDSGIMWSLRWIAESLITGIEYVGDIFSDIIGLSNSRYEWATQANEQRIAEIEEKERQEEQQKRWDEIAALNSKQEDKAPSLDTPSEQV